MNKIDETKERLKARKMNARLTAKTMVCLEGANLWNLVSYYQVKENGKPNMDYKTIRHYKSFGLFEEIEEKEYRENNHCRSDKYLSYCERYYRRVLPEEEK